MGKEVTEYMLCGLWVYPSDPEQGLKKEKSPCLMPEGLMGRLLSELDRAYVQKNIYITSIPQSLPTSSMAKELQK